MLGACILYVDHVLVEQASIVLVVSELVVFAIILGEVLRVLFNDVLILLLLLLVEGVHVVLFRLSSLAREELRGEKG